MKHMLLAAMMLAGLFVPALAHAQAFNCYMVCSPPRMYCQPAGTPLPPIQRICGSFSEASASDALFASLQSDASAPVAPACVAQQVFNEETQTYEWQMDCD